MDVFSQFCELKKKEYDLSLNTTLDTQELEDLDMTILLMLIEGKFGVRTIPSDALKQMQTFYDIADYISQNIQKGTAYDDKHTTKETDATRNVHQQIVRGIGCMGYLVILSIVCAVLLLTDAIAKSFGASDDTSALWTIIAIIASIIMSYRFLKKTVDKKNQDEANQTLPNSTKENTNEQTQLLKHLFGIILQIIIWVLSVIAAYDIMNNYGVDETTAACAGVTVGAIGNIILFVYYKGPKKKKEHDGYSR